MADTRDELLRCDTGCLMDEVLARRREIAALRYALGGLLNATGHTDACTEMQMWEPGWCSKKCQRARAALGLDATEEARK